MMFLTVWTVRPGVHEKVTERFLRTEAKAPQGIRTIGRWHLADGTGGVHVYECEDLKLIRQFSYEWGDVLELTTKPVLEDAEVGEAVMKAMAS